MPVPTGCHEDLESLRIPAAQGEEEEKLSSANTIMPLQPLGTLL